MNGLNFPIRGIFRLHIKLKVFTRNPLKGSKEDRKQRKPKIHHANKSGTATGTVMSVSQNVNFQIKRFN